MSEWSSPEGSLWQQGGGAVWAHVFSTSKTQRRLQEAFSQQRLAVIGEFVSNYKHFLVQDQKTIDNDYWYLQY